MFGLFNNITFVQPGFFLLLLLLPILAVWYYFRHRQRHPNIKMSNLEAFKDHKSLRARLRPILPLLRALSFIALVTAMARPQEILKEKEITAEGIDICLVMDLSSSMLARDFKPDRLEVSKQVGADFINKRQHDRIGLAVFAGEAFTQCPITSDHKVVKEFLASLQCGMLEDGTAIGMGLATAVNRLKDSDAKSKIVILLTDGVNNAGYVKPLTAAEIAREFGVKVYTIGVGSTGNAMSPVSRRGNGQYIFGLAKVEIDEELLTQIAEMTGGQYYRATNEAALQEIYYKIDRLEKTKMEVTAIKRHNEEFYRFAFLGLIFLLLEIVLRNSVLRTIP